MSDTYSNDATPSAPEPTPAAEPSTPTSTPEMRQNLVKDLAAASEASGDATDLIEEMNAQEAEREGKKIDRRARAERAAKARDFLAKEHEQLSGQHEYEPPAEQPAEVPVHPLYAQQEGENAAQYAKRVRAQGAFSARSQQMMNANPERARKVTELVLPGGTLEFYPLQPEKIAQIIQSEQGHEFIAQLWK